jgi:hypothetical protein
MLASDIYHRRWQSGVVELLQCQQWQERSLFRARCEWLKDAPDRDVLIDKRNKLDLRPFWRPAIPGTLIEYPDSPPEDKPKFTRTGTPLPDEDISDLEDAWNPRADIADDCSDGWQVDASGWTIGRKASNETFSSYFALSTSLISLDGLIGVDETWLDDELRKLPLFLILASGSRALNRDTENVQATLKSSSPGDIVDLRLLRANRPHEVSNVHIRHILPVHPSAEDVSVTATAKQYLVFIRGSLKGEFRLLDKVEGDRVWVKNPDGGELSEHSRFDLVLSREVKSKKVKGKDKGKRKGP